MMCDVSLDATIGDPRCKAVVKQMDPIELTYRKKQVQCLGTNSTCAVLCCAVLHAGLSCVVLLMSK